jgi:hypothetical protein
VRVPARHRLFGAFGLNAKAALATDMSAQGISLKPLRDKPALLLSDLPGSTEGLIVLFS